MDENAQNLLRVLSEFQWPETATPVYRLYHDDAGQPMIYTMDDLPGNYIEISRDDFFLSSMDCRVIDGRIVHPIKNQAKKLRPGDSGTACHPKDVCVVVDDDSPNIRWSF